MGFPGRLSLLCLAVGGVVAVAPRADAALVFSYNAGMPTYAASAAGQTISVPVYLTETVTAGSTSLLASEGGLFSAGLAINRTVGSATITGLTTNAGFVGLNTSSVGAGAASFSESLDLNATSGVTATSLGNGVSDVLLGTLSIASTDVPTTFTVSAFVNGNGTTGGNTLTFADLDDLDTASLTPTYLPATAGTFTVSTTPVATPEPASLSLVGLAAAGLLGRRRRA